MSLAEEREIARRYMGGVPLFEVAWGLGGFILWLALWPLAINGVVPLWAAFVVATVILCYSYLPSHEAQHGNIGRPGTRWRWLNETVGHLSMLPMLIPYRLHRAIHLKHHAHANDPDRDPDIYIRSDTIWQAIYKAWLSKQPGKAGGIQPGVLDDSPNKDRLVLEAFVVNTAVWTVMALMAWSGFALEVLLIWWLPRQVAGIYLPVTLSWAPHHPMRETGRYRDTRAWKSPVGTILSAGMEYHVVHHLFPSIPLSRTPAAYRELRPLLEKEGVSLQGI